jgi:hypothetical protein
MWVPITEEELVRIIDLRIVNYKKNLPREFLTATFVGLVLAATVLGALLFSPQAQASFPVADPIIYFIVAALVFVGFELVLLALLVRGLWRFNRMDLAAKRADFEKHRRKTSSGRLCLQCEKVYSDGERNCPNCGSTLKDVADYMWVDTEKKE